MAEVDLSDVMEHLAIAFGGIYEKLSERDMVVNTLSTQIVQLNDDVTALSNRIEGIHRNLSERIAALEVSK